MTPIEDLNSRFTYALDRDQYGHRLAWYVLTDPGAIRGDCEDYALTLAWLECGRSWPRFLWALWRRRFEMWSGTAGGRRHAVLRDTAAGKWADNIHRAWVDDLGRHYEVELRRHPLMVYRKLVRSWLRL